MAKRNSQLALLCLAFMTTLACKETPETVYDSRSEAEHSGAINRGWVPSLVPAGSTAIRESHDVDTNEFFGTFHFPSSDAVSLKAGLIELDASSLPKQPLRPPALKWWPTDLKGILDHQKLSSAGLTLCKSKQDFSTFFAVNWQKGEAFFWRTGPYQPANSTR